MSGNVALTADQLAEVTAILAEHLPATAIVGVFGSRAGGRVKPFSDLDLVIEDDGPLPLSTIAALAEAFDEAPLPFKVDIVDRRSVGEAFGRVIDATRIDLVACGDAPSRSATR